MSFPETIRYIFQLSICIGLCVVVIFFIGTSSDASSRWVYNSVSWGEGGTRKGKPICEQGAQKSTPSKCSETRPGRVGREACPSP